MTAELAILHQLSKRPGRPQRATDLMEVLGMEHDACYGALIAMEAQDFVAVARNCTHWRITPAGDGFLDWVLA